MSLAQGLREKMVESSLPLEWARELAARIRSVAHPHRIVLFGSAAEGLFRESSDLDVLLVFADVDALRTGRAAVRQLGRLSLHCPVDLVFVTEERFQAQMNLGGICFIAAHEGMEL